MKKEKYINTMKLNNYMIDGADGNEYL